MSKTAQMNMCLQKQNAHTHARTRCTFLSVSSNKLSLALILASWHLMSLTFVYINVGLKLAVATRKAFLNAVCNVHFLEWTVESSFQMLSKADAPTNS